MKSPRYTYKDLLPPEFLTSLDEDSCRLYEIVWAGMSANTTTQIMLTDSEASKRAGIKPEVLQASQSSLVRLGLLDIWEPSPTNPPINRAVYRFPDEQISVSVNQ